MTPPDRTPPAEPAPTDMSPEAIDRRLRDVSDLWDLWTRLEADRRDGKLVIPDEPAEGAVAHGPGREP